MSSHPFRLATFNVENLFSRPDFWDPQRRMDQQIGNVFFEDREEAIRARRIAEATLSDDKCQLTALALLQANADIIALQEVDSEAALKSFRENYLKKLERPHVAQRMREVIFAEPRPDAERVRRARDMAIAEVNYRYLAVPEGNDRRGIDIGLLSRIGWQGLRSHAAVTFEDIDVWPEGIETYKEGPPENPRFVERSNRVFKRDLVEVDFIIDGRPFTLFCCHLKSMTGGRGPTRIIRTAEAMAVRALIERRFADHHGGPGNANWAICGDLNDYMEIDGEGDIRDYVTGEDSPGALGPLLDDGFAVNIMARRERKDRWTTYHAPDDIHCQLDYILLSPRLAAANPNAVPEVIRAGLPYRATRYEGPRFPRIGWDRPKASDHCPVVVALKLP
ncbi:MAG: endonuclease/exonuclease/phosphatase family protein [Proteobacteria bacterium]|nr:endonuclease/exonuclease/phosphatase family protein [Pseudomonadota bacterium]